MDYLLFKGEKIFAVGLFAFVLVVSVVRTDNGFRDKMDDAKHCIGVSGTLPLDINESVSVFLSPGVYASKTYNIFGSVGDKLRLYEDGHYENTTSASSWYHKYVAEMEGNYTIKGEYLVSTISRCDATDYLKIIKADDSGFVGELSNGYQVTYKKFSSPSLR